ncbi:sialidase family protein [Catalinimonas alkaloidigena]|uniref:sialidase family protein n=1 Tax=Catalinimonas alkaloidigena TaxID=1075417 RepID=UPI0024067F93|nr:sialidase family protein [Catalinimonas alkaloidigena]
MKGIYLYMYAWLLCVPVFAQDEHAEIAEGISAYHLLFDASAQDSVSCYRIPALITATNGDLLAAIDERVPSCGDLKWSDDINIVMRRSEDNGKSWSEVKTIIDFPLGQSASDPSFILDEETGEVFLFYNFMDLKKEKDVYYLHMMKSKDHGQSWSEPEDITTQITKPDWQQDLKFITSGRGTQTREGRLLHCLVNLDKGMHLFGSDDHGESWFLIDTPIKPADESKVVELADGRWMINSRVNELGLRYVHISDDEGKSWVSQPDSSLLDPGCNASLIRYNFEKDGESQDCLLFSNLKSEEGRRNLNVRVSYDEGQSWTEGKVIYPGEAAYSSLTILKDGKIGLLFEKDDYTENVFVSFTFDWLTTSRE